jgi:hypothetical protein
VGLSCPLQAATTSLGLCVGFRGSIWPDRVKMAALPATLLEKVGSQFLSLRQLPFWPVLQPRRGSWEPHRVAVFS